MCTLVYLEYGARNIYYIYTKLFAVMKKIRNTNIVKIILVRDNNINVTL